MRKRGRKIKQVMSAPPPMVVMHTTPEVGIIQHQALMAFAGGWAENQHFSTLVDVSDHLLLGADGIDDGVQGVAHAGRLALMNISDRYQQTKRVGCSGDELRMLRAMVEVSEDFWARQSGAHYAKCKAAMDRFREILEEKNSIAKQEAA